jgi:hypothetical protein
MKKTIASKGKYLTARAVDAMSDTERAKLAAELDAQTPEERDAQVQPMTAELRAARRRIRTKMGRPPIGKGSQAISLTVEKELLGRATLFAKRKGIKRAELFARGLRLAMGEK